MSSMIQRGDKWVRPHFSWQEHSPSATPTSAATGQCVESLRNVCEEILRVLERTEKTLARMDRRLAKHAPLWGSRR